MDILTNVPQGPELSATSDMPVSQPAETPNAGASASGADGGGDAGQAKAGEGASGAASSATRSDKGAEGASEGGEGGDGAAAAAAANQDDGGQQGQQQKKSGINERFSELTAKRKEAEEAAAAANARADKLSTTAETLTKNLSDALETIKQMGGSKEADAIKASQAADPQPKREQFETPDQYDAALVKWATREGARAAAAEFEQRQAEARQKEENDRKTRTEEEQRTAQQRLFEESSKAFAERRTKAIEQMPDYETVAENPEVQITPHMGALILGDSNGPQIAYHLGKNPQEAARIAALPVAQQLFEMGRIAAEVARPKPNVSKAPPPVKPISGTNANATERSLDELSPEEYAAKRTAQNGGKPIR